MKAVLKSLWPIILALSALILPSVSQAAQPEVTAGLSWLQAQIQADGSLLGESTSIAMPLQSRDETLNTLTALDTVPAPLIQGIAADTDDSTESIARRMSALTASGTDTSTLVARILARQNRDGGFGAEDGYASSALDTAWALMALHTAGANDGVPAALGYLQNTQSNDGSFTSGNIQPDGYVTAYVILAMKPYASQYALGSTLQTAVDYLQAQRATGALWGGSVFLTALDYMAVHDFVPLTPTGSDINQVLVTAQGANGSWEGGDPYVTALALRALAMSTQIPPDQNKGAIGGKITDTLTGLPLSGATVNISGAANTSTTTGADGRYSIINLPTGVIQVAVTLNGYLSTQTTATISAGNTVQYSPALAKSPQPVPIVLNGVVKDADQSNVLSGAVVSVAGTSQIATSGTDGKFVLDGIPAGSILVQVTLAGYASATFSISAPSGGNIDLGVITLHSANSNIGNTGLIQGHISDALSGLPLSGVLVSVSGANTQATFTDVNGDYSLTNLPPGDVSIIATMSGYQQAMGQGTVIAGSTLGFNARLVKSTNPALVTVQGKVIDAATTTPLVGVTVTVSSGPQTITTGTDGRFTLGDAQPENPLAVTLSLPGYNSVTYTANAPGGTLLSLGTVTLASNTPVSGNHAPVINSTGPKQASAGVVYAYNVSASDADGDTLTYALDNHPSGMTIDKSNGQIRWIPTLAQVGALSFKVAVFDTKGAVAWQSVDVNVDSGGSKAYVVTDVQTLNGLGIDTEVPANYVLGQYISGGHPGAIIAAYSCPLNWHTGSGTFASAMSSLERLSGSVSRGIQPEPGADLIMDLGQPFSTVTVFPQIDHAPFPQEGIEYTVWGSNDPNATFPSGWKLGTLMGIYRKGYVTDSSCSGQTETDDYSGLYTFTTGSYRYIRVRADYSITIFNTPAHIHWQGYADDSGQPGWQSMETEIDSVGGMNCSIKPTVDAGPPITGSTGNPVQFDGTGSQANIVRFGWDIDGDGVIDLTGPKPTYTFNTAVDQDVTLYAVDDQGCVGVSTVHTTIGLNVPKPDLTISGINTDQVAADPQTLFVSGSMDVTIANIGHAPAEKPVLVTVFEDIDDDGMFTPGIDIDLGALTMPTGLPSGASLIMSLPITGKTLVPGRPLSVMVDSNHQIDEEREDNNTYISNTLCRDATHNALPDLSIGALRVTGQTPALINATIGNDGLTASTETIITFYEGDPSSNGRLLGQQTIPALQPGTHQIVTLSNIGLSGNNDIYAVVDPENKVPECNKMNNVAHSPVFAPPSLNDITVSTDRASYGPETNALIEATVTNPSSFDSTAQVRFTIETADGSAVVSALPLPASVNIPYGGSQPVQAIWNTGQIFVGNYRVKAELLDAQGKPYASATTPFAIINTQATNVNGTITTDKASYAPIDTATIQDRILNATANTLSDNLTVDTQVLNPDGSIRWQQNTALSQLSPNELSTLTYAVPLTNATPGTYKAILTVFSGTIPVTASNTSFTVRSSADTGIGISGDLHVSPKQVPLGENLTLNASVTNQGNATITGLPVMVSVIDPDAQQLLFQQPTTLSSLSSGSSSKLLNSWVTRGVVGKTYMAVLSATINGKTLTLAKDSFVLLPPPIKLDVKQALSTQSRVLVLLSCQDGKQSGEDHHSNRYSRCVQTRQTTIDGILSSLGIKHLITTDVPSFVKAKRSGIYNNYWILGGVDKWRDTLSDELRESVFRGDGLLLDASLHDWHNHALYEVGGVKYTGKLWLSDQHISLNGTLVPSGIVDAQGRPLRLRITSGEEQASFDGMRCEHVECNSGDDKEKDEKSYCQPISYPAIVSNNYGQGHALVLGFDLAGSLNATSDRATWLSVIKSMLVYLQPATSIPPNVFPPLGYIPLDTFIQNEGVATDLNIGITLPDHSRYIDSDPSATLTQSGDISWLSPLAKDAKLKFATGFSAPSVAGTHSVQTQINTITDGVDKPYDQYQFDFIVSDSSLLVLQLQNALDLLTLSHEDRRQRDQAHYLIQKAELSANNSKYSEAIDQLLEAADKLIKIHDVDISGPRLTLDRLIQIYTLQWFYHGGTFFRREGKDDD